MRNLILTLCLLVGVSALQAQNYTDALRYSNMSYLGTARFNAMGGSFGALGGEISGLSTNPAGIGIYRNSEFTFSTGFLVNTNETSFRNSLRNDSKFNFNIPNIGYVGSYKGDPNGWKNYSFAVGYNRLASFHSEQQIDGISKNGSSRIDDFVNQLNAAGVDVLDVEDYAYPFGASHAYWIYMLNPTSNNTYAREVQGTSAIIQSESTSTRGSMNETFFSFGGNYQDKFYLGGTVALTTARFEEEREFTEEYQYQPNALPQDSVGVFYEENTNLLAQGSGFTAKLGAIYKVSQAIRIGAAIHAPTLWGLTEEYSFQAESKFSEGTTYDNEDETFSNWQYRLHSPWRFIGSAAFVYRNNAAFNVEYEYVNYSNMRFNDKRDFRFDYSEANNDIRDVTTGAHNFRFGMEYKLNPFLLRAGFRYEDSPFDVSELSLNPDQSRKIYSLGGGYRSGNFNIDASFQYAGRNGLDPVYTTSDATADVTEVDHRLVVTLGWKW